MENLKVWITHYTKLNKRKSEVIKQLDERSLKYEFIENYDRPVIHEVHEDNLNEFGHASEICIEELNNDPGIFSARWAGVNKDFNLAMVKVEKKLLEKGLKSSKAYFYCALAVAWPDKSYKIYEGAVHGNLRFPPKGKLGFGYDPIFIPNGFDISFGEMSPSRKHSMSHRAEAFRKLKKELLDD